MLKADTIVVICAIVLLLLLLIATYIYKLRRDYRDLRAESPVPEGVVYQFNLCCITLNWSRGIWVCCYSGFWEDIHWPPLSGWEAYKAAWEAKKVTKERENQDRAERDETEPVPRPLYSILVSYEDHNRSVTWQEGRPGAIKVYSRS